MCQRGKGRQSLSVVLRLATGAVQNLHCEI